MSWFYRIFKLQPVSSGRTESDIQVNNVDSITFTDATAINLANTAQPTVNFQTANVAIFASTATPWLTATTKAGTAGAGSLWLCSSGTIFIKTTGTGTLGWKSVLAVAT